MMQYKEKVITYKGTRIQFDPFSQKFYYDAFDNEIMTGLPCQSGSFMVYPDTMLTPGSEEHFSYLFIYNIGKTTRMPFYLVSPSEVKSLHIVLQTIVEKAKQIN